MKRMSWVSALAMIVMISVFSAPLSSTSWAGMGNKDNPQVIPPQAKPFGKSYAEWSAEWWEWQLYLPAADHPAFSTDGTNCDAGQSGKVWFLTGAFTTEDNSAEFSTIIRESCEVPTGKAIFFPIINVGCTTVESDSFELITEGDGNNADTCAAKFVDGTVGVVEDLLVEIDGRTLKNLDAYRIQSPVFGFEFADPTDNILGVDCDSVDCENMQSVSDGYWIMLPPLSSGEHTVRFTGSFRDPSTGDLFFGLDVTYVLTVAGGKI